MLFFRNISEAEFYPSQRLYGKGRDQIASPQ